MALQSKIRSVTTYVSQLLEKKYRLDLEIRRQKKSLLNLKKVAHKTIKESLEPLGISPKEDKGALLPLSEDEQKFVRKSLSNEEWETLFSLDKELDELYNLREEIIHLNLGKGITS